MKMLLSLLLGASLAYAQKKCLAAFHKEEKGRCELYAEQAGLEMVIDDTQNIVGGCEKLDRAQSVILKRHGMRDHSWVYTTKNPKQSYNSMMTFLTGQSDEIDSKHKLTLTYNYKTRDGARRAMTVKSDMDLWAAFLLQGRFENVELQIDIATNMPTSNPTTAMPTPEFTTPAPTTFKSNTITNEEDLNWLNDLLKERVGAKLSNQVSYRMMYDGKATATFRRFASNKGPWIFVIKTTNGHTFGGYNDQSWTDAGGSWFYCDNCFLFILKGRNYEQKIMEQYQNKNYAQYHHTSYGPCFGGSTHDICITGPTSTPPSGYTRIGYTYKSPTGSSNYYIDSDSTYNFKVAEWEIIPVVGQHHFFSYIMTEEADQLWMNKMVYSMHKGRKIGTRCFRFQGLGKKQYSNMVYFRNACAVRGPLLLVVKQRDTGYIFGGYTGAVKSTPNGWCSNACGYKYSDEAFLWILKGKGDSYSSNVPYEKVIMKQKQNKHQATYHHTSYGPCFGGGHDLCINSPSSQYGYGNVGSTYYHPSSTDEKKVTAGYQFGNFYFAQKSSGISGDFEVYTIEDGHNAPQ